MARRIFNVIVFSILMVFSAIMSLSITSQLCSSCFYTFCFIFLLSAIIVLYNLITLQDGDYN